MNSSNNTTNPDFKAQLRAWRREATKRYAMAMGFLLITPLLAVQLQRFAPPGVLNSWLARHSIGGWEITYVVAFLFLFISFELASISRVRDSKSNYPPRVGETLAELARRAGLPETPMIIYLPEQKLLNAFALRSFTYGAKVILMGDIRKLNEAELTAVLAHEVAHLRMRDVRTGHFIKAFLLGAKLVNLLVGIATVVSIFVPIFTGTGYEVTWFLAGTLLVFLLGRGLAQLYYLGYSRTCEYRADAIAIELTSPQHRKYLMSAIEKVQELGLVMYTRERMEKSHDWHHTHPSRKHRAQSLGIDFVRLAVS